MDPDTAGADGDREEEKPNLKYDSSADIFYFRKMPRHIFSDVSCVCCGEEAGNCLCMKDSSLTMRQESEEIALCKCVHPSTSSIVLPKRKLRILTTVSRTEDYLTKKRIPQLLRWLVTKVTAETPKKPCIYLENLLDKMMLFRAGIGMPPVLYEDRHLKAMIKSFDPGNRGWMSAGQVKRLYATMGIEISPPKNLEDKISTDEVFNMVKKDQENELFALVTAGDAEKTPPITPANSVVKLVINYDKIVPSTKSDKLSSDI